jgi:hypothetical protein
MKTEPPREILTLDTETMHRVAPYLLNPRFNYGAARYECDPSSPDVLDIHAAFIAEKLLNA